MKFTATSTSNVDSEQTAVAPPVAAPTKKLYALRRCRYRSKGEIVVAERFDEIVAPDPADLSDLRCEYCVEEFDTTQIDALRSLGSVPSEKRTKLLAMLGL